MNLINIETNDGENRVITPEDHQNMVRKYGINNLPYVIISDDKIEEPNKQKIYGGPEPYGPDYTW